MNRVLKELEYQTDRIKIYNDPPSRDTLLVLFEEAAHEIERLADRIADLQIEVEELEAELEAELGPSEINVSQAKAELV